MQIRELMPRDTPLYMCGAWIECLVWAIGQDEIVSAFRAQTGHRWQPPTNRFDALIDEATGHGLMFVEDFVLWANDHVWGPLAGPVKEN